MRFSFQTSTGRLMLLVIVAAAELALFQDVWRILVIPPITIATLALNLGLWFLLVRPRWMESRIVSMQLSGITAAAGEVLYMWIEFRPVLSGVGYQEVGPVGAWLITTATAWGQSLPDQGATPVILLRGVANGATIIEFILLDLCGLAMIWAAGSVEYWLRRRCQGAGGGAPAGSSPY